MSRTQTPRNAVPAEEPTVSVQITQDVTTQGQSHSPRELASLRLHNLPSGQFPSLATSAETVAAAALSWLRNVEAALPSDRAQDALVEKLFAEAVGGREAHPLPKPAR